MERKRKKRGREQEGTHVGGEKDGPGRGCQLLNIMAGPSLFDSLPSSPSSHLQV